MILFERPLRVHAARHWTKFLGAGMSINTECCSEVVMAPVRAVLFNAPEIRRRLSRIAPGRFSLNQFNLQALHSPR
jgi:hypothetical protein